MEDHLIIRVLSLTFFESISYIIWHLVVNWYYTNVFFQPLLLGAYISRHTKTLHVLCPYNNEFSLWSSVFSSCLNILSCSFFNILCLIYPQALISTCSHNLILASQILSTNHSDLPLLTHLAPPHVFCKTNHL